jgi:poly(A) polymerase
MKILSGSHSLSLPFETVLKLPPPDWMVAAQTQAVLGALAGQVLFVGGCVRNLVMGREATDIDLATPLLPQEVLDRLEAAGIVALRTGIEHGTITAVVDKKPYEITTLRSDIETDGRHATVAFGQDWLVDARRRDFTLNTLLADSHGHIYDPLGCGLADALAGRILFVGDPRARIEEDYLRILRFFRFHAHYGTGAPDADALAACTRAAPFIFALSHERITNEFFKILHAENANATIDLMDRAGILHYFNFPAWEDPARDRDLMPSLCAFQKYYGLISILSRLYVFADGDKDNVHKLETLLIIPKVFKKEMFALAAILSLPDLDHEHSLHVSLYKYGRAITAQALMFGLAKGRVANEATPAALAIINDWPIPEFPISGRDLLGMGLKEGPNIGRILEKLQEWWIAEEFKPNRRHCLDRAKTYLKRI